MVKCGECSTRLDEPADLPADQRKPCPKCGSFRRTFEEKISTTVKVTTSVSGTVERGLNDLRLAVLGILAAIGIAVSLGASDTWWIQILAGVGSVLVASALIRVRWTRSKMMFLMHWLTGR